jgi:hypothetical protein
MKKAPTTYQADGALGKQLAFITRQRFCPNLLSQASEEHDSLETLQALAGTLGLVLHPITASSGSTAFLVARKAASREFSGLDGARHFVNEWAGGCRG